MNFHRWKLTSLKLVTAALALGHAAAVFSQSPSTPIASSIVVFSEIRGTINPATAEYLKASIEEAESLSAQALVVELDTPGGLVSSVRSMAQYIDDSSVPVVVYVSPAGASATSAGALLSLASHVAIMSPGSNIGAAHPVDSGGKDISGAMGEKAVNDTVAFSKGLAEIRGRNRDLAEQVVSKSKSFTAAEALKQNLIEGIASSRSELLGQINGRKVTLKKGGVKTIDTRTTESRNYEMTTGQKMLHFLANPNIATILMTLGMLCLYLELSTPGVGIAGALGAVSLIIAFMSFQLLPIRAGGLTLLLLGLACLIAEPFVVSGGALALGGTVSFILGIFWVLDPHQSGLEISKMVWIPAALLMGSGALSIAFVAARIKKQVSDARAKMGGEGKSGLQGYHGRVESLRDETHGKCHVRGETWDFESASPVGVGDQVQVDRVEGFKIFVSKLS